MWTQECKSSALVRVSAVKALVMTKVIVSTPSARVAATL